MKTNNFRKALVFLSVTFIFLCLVEEKVFALVDSADVRIISTTVYPGRFRKLEVKLKNSTMPIGGFQLTINASNPELFNFHTQNIQAELDTLPIDTCTWEPESLHYQHPECYKDSLIFRAVRNIYIDTVGSLISGFKMVHAHGTVGDTSRPDCKEVEVLGMHYPDSAIDPYSNYRTLFKLGVDLFCIPDSTTDRTLIFLLGANSRLSDPNGNSVPFRFQQGSMTLFISTPGDANGDSLCGLGDVVFLISYLYKAGARSCIPEASDVNGDCVVGLGDVIYLISYLYKGGPPPLQGCWHGLKKE